MRGGARDTGPGRIRVLIVASEIWVGGTERNMLTLLPAMDRERFTFRVCSVKAAGVAHHALMASGIECTALGLMERRQAPRAFLGVLAEVRRFRPHVVLTFSLNADVLGRAAATIAGVPVAAAWKHSCGHVREHPLDRWSERLLAPLTDYCIGVAESQTRFLVGELGVPRRKIRIVYNGVDLSGLPAPGAPRDPALASELGIDVGAPVVAVLARLRPEKDHPTFLRAARKVADRRPDTRFLILGDGEERPRLETMARELGVAGCTVFAGHRDDVGRVLTLPDVSVLSSYNDCFPYSALESMAAGLPVVSTAVGALPEIVEDGVTGHLVPARDPASLAGRVLGLIGHPRRARAMGQAGRERVERLFTLERTVREMARVLQEMVDSPRRRSFSLRGRRGRVA